MVRAVFDTNVLVSIIIRGGKPRELWNKVLENEIQLVTSHELLSEFNEVISRPQFRKYIRRRTVLRFWKIVLRVARVTKIRSDFHHIKEDPSDNAVLEAAFDGRAEYIISGDSHLLILQSFRGIRIVDIREMLRILKGD